MCGSFAGPGIAPLLECGVASGLVPPPPRPGSSRCGGLDFAADRVRLNATGKSYGFCAGDVGVLAERGSAPVLAHGATRHAGPFTCSSTVAWLTCRNTSGHGFALSRRRWRSF